MWINLVINIILGYMSSEPYNGQNLNNFSSTKCSRGLL